jgi:hypothetical protein
MYALLQGAMGYNNSDGGAYVLIKDTPAASGNSSSGSSSSKSAAITTESSFAKANSTADLEALFRAAAKGNWSTGQWIAASSSRSNVTAWRKLLEWPFGEDGGVFRFNKAGDALYIVTSIGRWARGRDHLAGFNTADSE